MKKFHSKPLLAVWIIFTFLTACSGPSPVAPIATALPTHSIPNTGPTAAPVQPTPASSNASPKPPAYWPTQDWRASTPEQQGMDSAQISKLFDAIQKANETVQSLVIVRNGFVVTEAYYAPFQPDARHNLNTITESVVSILIGIAIQQGYIKGVDQKMLDFFPDRKMANLDARKQAVTIKDLLTMTSGLFTSDDIGASPDWVQFALDLWILTTPGVFWSDNIDSRGGYHLLSAIIQKSTGMTTLAFANKVLFEPLGITDAAWLTDPQGITFGGSYLFLTSRDMAKIGYLYLNQGEWNGKQIVPREYVLASTKHLFNVPGRHGWGYGYGWLIAPDGSYAAEGDYGQVISVKPEQGIVTVFAGGAVRDDFSLNEEDLIDQFIVTAAKSAGALPENSTSMALINDKITALEKPVPHPIPPLPELAQTISGKKYLLEDGEAFTLTFAGEQATLDWSFKNQSAHFPVGMDNVFRTTSFDLTEQMIIFGATMRLPGQGFVALRGNWTSTDTFELTLQNLNSNSRHTMIFKLAKDKVTIIHGETASTDSVSFQGQVQTP